MSDPFLRDATTYESNGAYFCILQRWIKQACINSGIPLQANESPLNVTTHESNGTYWRALQYWVKQAVINASIAIPTDDPLLTDINLGDSEGTKFAKLQRWLKLLATNI